MANNFSSCSLYTSEDFASAMWYQSAACDGGVSPYWMDWEMRDRYDYVGEGDRNNDGSCNLADLLPSDPFEMELSSTFSAAIAGWINDLGGDPGDYEVEDEYLVADLNYYWGQALVSSSSELQYSYEGEFNYWVKEELSGMSDFGFCSVEDYSRSDETERVLADCGFREFPNNGGDEVDGSGEVAESAVVARPAEETDFTAPHEGMFFALGYLGMRNLLIVERVCKSLKYAVQSDPLLWRQIHIDASHGTSNLRITDEQLLRLTQRAQGGLECLSLSGCSAVTDEGLKLVLDSNPKLKELALVGCVRLTIEGLMCNLKTFTSQGQSRLKHLKLGRLFNVSPEHYEELSLLVDSAWALSGSRQPWFYHIPLSPHPNLDDHRPIDIELCQICRKVKLVFDCPSEECRENGGESCRACEICILRCRACGTCITNRRYIETFCLDNYCIDCDKTESQGGVGVV